VRRIDLADTAARAQFTELAAAADVCVVGHRQAARAGLGTDAAALRARNPKLVSCHVSGWGSQGPYGDLPVTELPIQLAAGFTRFLGTPDGPPIRQGFDLVSVATGLAAAQAALGGLLWADETGTGQDVEVSMLATAIALQQWDIAAESGPDAWEGVQLTADTWPPDHGFRCADAQCLIDMRSHEEDWPNLLRDIGLPELAVDPRFTTRAALDLNDQELPALTADALSRWTFADLERLVRDTYGGTIVPMLDLRAVLHHPQVEHLGLVADGGRLRFPVEVVELR
jgi:crotonobetainyl-CoA:carnitine CoA-transferase CaiB-like acyl-CoA transferase